MSKIYRPHEFALRIGRSTSTLRRWDRTGKFPAKRQPSGQRYYDEADVRLALDGVLPPVRKTVVYCRVSRQGQQDDLQRQVAALETYCLSAGIAVDEWVT